MKLTVAFGARSLSAIRRHATATTHMSVDVTGALTSPIVAAILGVVTAVAAVVAVLRPRPRLRVTAHFYDPLFLNIPLPSTGILADHHPIAIEITNVGRRAVTVREAGFHMEPPLLVGGERITFMRVNDPKLPMYLDPGQSHSTHAPPAKQPATRFARAVAVDTEGRIWRSTRRPLA